MIVSSNLLNCLILVVFPEMRRPTPMCQAGAKAVADVYLLDGSDRVRVLLQTIMQNPKMKVLDRVCIDPPYNMIYT